MYHLSQSWDHPCHATPYIFQGYNVTVYSVYVLAQAVERSLLKVLIILLILLSGTICRCLNLVLSYAAVTWQATSNLVLKYVA